MKLGFAGCVYAAALLIGGATGALAQDKTFELKLSHWVPPSHPLQKALEEWGASVEKDSGGTIKYKVYPSQQLGKAFERLRTHLPASTPLVFGHAVGRKDERVEVTTLESADPSSANMATLIIVGSAETRVIERPGWLQIITPSISH